MNADLDMHVLLGAEKAPIVVSSRVCVGTQIPRGKGCVSNEKPNREVQGPSNTQRS